MEILESDALTEALADLDGWTVDGQTIVKTYSHDTYPEAVAFIVRMAFEAEAAHHHPDLMWSWTTVEVRLSTHSAGGVTRKDVELAAALDAVR